MRFCAGEAGTELALFTGLRAARGTTNRQRFLLCNFHPYTMHANSPTRWSIVTIAQSSSRRIMIVGEVEDGSGGRGSSASVDSSVFPRSLFLGAISCSNNRSKSQINPPNRR